MNFKTMLLIVSASASLLCSQGWAQAKAPVLVRGEIVAIDATSMTVRAKSGEPVKIAVKPDQAVLAVKNLPLADIKPGAYVGVATRPGSDPKLVAIEVLVFAESARGTAEGHYPWDLTPGGMMTNGNVDTAVAAVNGRVLTLSYKGGTKEITVPEGAPVVTPIPAARADLLAGKKVFVVVTGDPAAYSAARVYVEKDGVAPPM